MEKQKRVYQAIKSESDRIDLNVDYDTLFFFDEDTAPDFDASGSKTVRFSIIDPMSKPIQR